jgi:glycosyltransferase involved in cell wall biosynthesis
MLENFENNPFVSVIMCNYNYGNFIAEAMESVLSQTYRHFELIVVDDGSTDNSREVIGDARIQTVFKENGGQASAFNAGMKYAKGALVAFLDSDDRWKKDKIEKVVQAYEKGEYSVVQHNLDIIDGNSQLIDRIHPGVEPGTRNVLQAYFLENRTNFFSATSGIVCRMTDLMKIFPLDEEQWRICADVAITRPLPIFGEVCTLGDNLGCYRIHHSNSWMNTVSQSQRIANRLKEVEFTNVWLANSGYPERLDFTKSEHYQHLKMMQLPFYHPNKLWRLIKKKMTVASRQ